MLIDVSSGEPIDRIPHPDTWNAVQNRLEPAAIQAIFDEIEKRCEEESVHVAGWIPGPEWTGTPFQPIYDQAAQRDFELAAKMFGLFVWVYFMQRDDRWGFGRYDLRDQKVESMTYFRLRD